MVKKELTIKLMRHLLGSVDLPDLEDEKEMSANERKEYCAAIFAVWPRLEKDIKGFLYRQLMFSSNEAEDWDKVVFGRGTFNGMDLLYEHWKKAASEFESESKESKGGFNKSSPIAEL